MKNNDTVYSEVDIKAGVCNQCGKDVYYEKSGNTVYKKLLAWKCLCFLNKAKCTNNN